MSFNGLSGWAAKLDTFMEDTLLASVAGAVEEQAVATRDITRNMEEAASGTEQVVLSNGKVSETSKIQPRGRKPF